MSDTPATPVQTTERGALSQWQLIRMSFAKHKLAVCSLFFLLFLYFVAIFAEPFATQNPNSRNVDYAYCPPQTIRFSFSHGFYTYAMRQETDPITFRKTYVEETSIIVNVNLFERSQPYKLWGIIPLNRRVLAASTDQLQGESITPTFHLLGADKYGRDIFSRMIYGSRISLSVGLVGIVFTFILGMTIGGISGYASGWWTPSFNGSLKSSRRSRTCRYGSHLLPSCPTTGRFCRRTLPSPSC